MRAGIVGHGVAGFGIRGRRISQLLSWDVIDSAAPQVDGLYDVLVLVKYHRDAAALLRRSCGRLIFDPLDCWHASTEDLDPVAFWRAQHEVLAFDDILATSPSCFAVMSDAVGDRSRVHLARHAADSRIGADWGDDAGHVVYAGAFRYLGKRAHDTMERACRALGREFVCVEGDDCWRALQGAALLIHPRLPPHDTRLDRYCKPQIKAENAAAGGLRLLGTDDPALTSLRPEAPTVGTHAFYDVELATRALLDALASAPLRNPVTEAQHVATLRALVGAEAVDAVRPPRSPATSADSRSVAAGASPRRRSGPAHPSRGEYAFEASELLERARALAGEYRTAEPFPHVVLDDVLSPEVVDEAVACFPPPDAPYWTKKNAANSRKSFSHRSDKELRLPAPIRALLWDLNSAAFLIFLSELTGIEGLVADPYLEGGGIHDIEPGGFLNVHADFNYHSALGLDRRLNVLIYLNRDWQEDWGGHLELWTPDMSRCARRVSPIAGRCVIFNTTDQSFHGHPEPLQCPPGVTRKSIATYYYTAGRPAHEQSERHSTLYRRTPPARA